MSNLKVAVVGVGSMGSMALWQLAKAGIDAVGFEQFGLAHERSAAGGESRMFRTAYMEGADYVPMLKASRKLWQELEAETGQSLLNLNGALMIGPKSDERIANVIRSVEEFEIDHEVLDSAEAMKRYPQHWLDSDEIAVLDREGGVIRPEMAVFTAAERAVELGAQLRENCRVDSIVESGSGVRINADGKDEEFDKVIVTTGPWTARVFPQFADHLVPRKIVMTWYLSKKLDDYSSENFPAFGRVGGEIQTFGIPALEGTMTKIGSVATFGDVEVPEDLHRDVDLAELGAINREVARCHPGLESTPSRISVHMDAYTTDEHALVGPVPGSDKVFVLGGYSGHGFKLAPVMGEIAKDLAVDGVTSHPIAHLAPERFTV
ncbi:N-methyl-L-tryptophan oxidase [Brevibacterium spongiae]|uniref:N-methyl-L-tryptophan oxidase n=1 Tax=Brevibacterium spongiae TaxID=2909672 RepID=A0ABY5SQA9_9MICO|nr:N-methyl-L-tryptophan oxidase [Brevibacterium spongiae]UVI36682.1 N-methyl-L-tryptophan oxidase [Brevibacterium spongiae]